MKPRVSLPPALRLSNLGDKYIPPTSRPQIQYEAESSSAALRRQELESSASASTPSLYSPHNNQTWAPNGYAASNEKRRRGPKAIALLRAQQFAKALASAAPPSKIDIPLRSEPPTPPTAPTLADLEAKRPDREPPHVTARSYKKQYERLYNNIDQAFVAKQIIKMAPKLGVKLRKGRGKDIAIRGILKAWGWPDPKTAEMVYAARDVKERDWEMSRAELWLMMRDEGFVKSTLEGEIKLSVPLPTFGLEDGQRQNTRVLRGHGDSDALAEMDQRIADFRTMIEQNARISRPGLGSEMHGDAGLFGTISNASGVFLEPIANGAIRLAALDSAQLDKAVSLLNQAFAYASTRATTPLSLITPSSNLEMSLFPHIPTSISAIPWQEIGKLSKPLFRVRGVQPWETKVGMRDVAHREELLGDSQSYGVTNDKPKQSSLASMMAKKSSEVEGSTTTARFGHLLYPDASADASLLSPAKRASWTVQDVRTSPVAESRPVFFPSLPPVVIQFPILGPPRTIRRLRYQADSIKSRYLDISYELPPKPTEPTEDGSMPDTRLDSGSQWHKELDAQIASLDINEVEAETSTEAEEEVPIPEETAITLDARIVQEFAEDMMMPDRPIDVTMTSTTPHGPVNISDHLDELRQYLQHLDGSAPVTFHIEGEKYTLISAESLDILENDLSKTITPAENELDIQPSKVLLRTIKATDLTLGQGRVVRYAELETKNEGDISPAFWQQLAVLSRAVAPGAGQLRGAVY